MHFLKSIGKRLVFRFFSTLSLSYFGELVYYGYHLYKEAKYAMPTADAALQGWQWLKNRCHAFFSCLKNAWNEDPQRRYKMKNAAIWSVVNLCTYLLPGGWWVVALINLIGFAGDVWNETLRRSYDVTMAEELKEDVDKDDPIQKSIDERIKESKNKKMLEVGMTVMLFTCMVFYFVPFVNIALIAATGIILLISSFFVARNLLNLGKSVKRHCSRYEVELPACDSQQKKPDDSHSLTLIHPSAPACAPSSTASVITCTDDPVEKRTLKKVDSLNGLSQPKLEYAVSAPVLYSSSSLTQEAMTRSKSEGDLTHLPEVLELEILEKWIEKVKTIIKTNSTENVAVILQNLTLQETRELRSVLGLKSHKLWRQRFKDWMNLSKNIEENKQRLFSSYTLLNALEAQRNKAQGKVDVLKRAQVFSKTFTSKVAYN